MSPVLQPLLFKSRGRSSAISFYVSLPTIQHQINVKGIPSYALRTERTPYGRKPLSCFITIFSLHSNVFKTLLYLICYLTKHRTEVFITCLKIVNYCLNLNKTPRLPIHSPIISICNHRVTP